MLVRIAQVTLLLISSVFVADAATREAGGRLLRRSQQSLRQPVLFIPKIGLGNITAATPFPPLPPLLDPRGDRQPFDTQIGSVIAYEFAEVPTLKPLPSQAALNLAFGCPVLLGWPVAVEIEAPGHCIPKPTPVSTDSASPVAGLVAGSADLDSAGEDAAKAAEAAKAAAKDEYGKASGQAAWVTGNWSNSAGGGHILQYSEACPLFDGSSTPLVTYTMPNGDLFGFTQLLTTLYTNIMELRDCSGFVRYRIEEKIYREKSKVDEEACETYKSCDGTVYIQYFVYDEFGATVALTGYLTLFQGVFKITDTGGNGIATASRKGEWSPVSKDCVERIWVLQFDQHPPGGFQDVTNHWPIAELVTMMSLRDYSRLPSGMVTPTACEVTKSAFLLFGLAFAISLFVLVPCLFFVFCQHQCRVGFLQIEQHVFPRRMRRPVCYEA